MHFKRKHKSCHEEKSNVQLNLKYSSLVSKIRIGFVSEFLTDHTIGKLFSSLILDLDANKFDVTVFHSSKTKKGYIKKLIDLKVRTVNLPLLLKDKIKVFENEKLDIVFLFCTCKGNII